jgi:class 3 adenylate cyclase/tetratricopeptide (TPR) repeat protein
MVFTDVVGSTALGERLDPEVLRRVMTTYFERMRRVLERHGGTVEKYIGDAIVAVFGIPELREDDALRAVRAASEMRADLEELNRELEDRHGVRIEARTGINTGEVLAEETRPDAPLTADAANTAARLEQAAGPGEILIGDPTYGLVRDAVTVEPAGPLDLRGKAASQAAWRLIEVAPEGPGVARRLDSPIVGRDPELSLLQRTFERATADRACRLVTVVGTPGVGKSRLSTEFTSWLEGRASVLRGRCLPYGDGITYLPVAEVVREAAAITGDDAAGVATAKITAMLGGHQEAGTIAERLGSVLGLSDVAAPAQETFWAVRRLLEALAERNPLVVVFDDIHWGEATFLDLVEYLAGWSTEAPILLLCLARPELLDARSAWGAAVADHTSIRLEPLTDEESERLIDNLLGRAPLEEDVRARIRSTAEGNPLFVEEILRMLVDQGLLRRDDGRWVAAGDLSSIAIPPTIGALLAARLEQLSMEERAVIQRAAVVGKVFWWGAVAELSPAPEQGAVGGHLQALVRRELVRPDRSRFTGEDAFRFGHILIRDAAYAGTTKELRAELHERFAGWLERRAGDRPAESDEVVGYHLEQAHRYRAELGLLDEHGRELARRAAELLGSAGERAFARYDIPAALSLLSRATALLDADDPVRVELLVPLGEALGEAGQVDRATAVLAESHDAANSRGDERLAAVARLGRWFAVRGEYDVEASLRDGREAVEVFERHDDRRGLSRAWALVGRANWHAGRAARAEGDIEEALRHAVEVGDRRREAECLLWLGAILAQGPRPAEEAAQRAEKVLEDRQGHRTIEAYMCHALAHLRAWQGRLEEGRTFARRYSAILRDNGQLASWAESLEALADVERVAGNSAEASRILLEGQRNSDDMGLDDRTLLPFLANALYTEDRIEEAEAAAVRSREAEHPLWGTMGTAVLGRIRARQGRREEAERLARGAVATLEASDFLVFRGRTLLDLAEVLRLLGREDEALPFARRAVETFDQKGASLLADQARSAARPAE